MIGDEEYSVFGVELIVEVPGILRATAQQFAISINKLNTRY
jgi:hypothetical protein